MALHRYGDFRVEVFYFDSLCRGGVGKSGVLEHKSGNISEMPKDRGKVTMEGL